MKASEEKRGRAEWIKKIVGGGDSTWRLIGRILMIGSAR